MAARRFWQAALATAGLAILAAVLGSCVAADPSPGVRRPNILFIVVEDLSPRIGAYGDAVARTPNIDRLAAEGVRFTRVFTTAGVCAPSRAALITGVHQSAIGAQHMRTSAYPWEDGSGRTGYTAAPQPHVKAFPEYLRAAGYYAVNNSKTDYQFGEPFSVWDESGETASWRNRPDDAPFFVMRSTMLTHESALFTPESTAGAAASLQAVARAGEAARATLPERTRPEDVTVPAYYPDTPAVRADIARQYDNVRLMDAWVGEVVGELAAAGVLDETIVIWTSDHGDGLPRGKRSLYDSGLAVPLIVRFPDRRGAGTTDDRMFSFVDIAPTILAMAGAPAPPHLHGRDMFAPGAQGREHVFAARDRLDEHPDEVRAVRSERFKYIVNLRPEQPFYQQLDFREHLPMMSELRQRLAGGALTPLQAGYFRTPRPAEELYDLAADPDEVVNLAADPRFAADKARLRAVLEGWRADIGGYDRMPERDMVAAIWPGGSRPVTTAPEIRLAPAAAGAVRVELVSPSEGASIGWRLDGETRWRLYTAAFEAPPGTVIEAKAVRYGWAESAVARREAKR